MTASAMTRRLLVLGMVALALTGCGRKGNPHEPENAVYPRVYPYTPLPAPLAKQTPDATGATPADEPFQAPQPRRHRPDELKPPAGETGRTP